MSSNFILSLCLMTFLAVGSNGHKTCAYKGKIYQPYTRIYSSFDAANNWCNVGICKGDGSIWRLVDVSCKEAKETMKDKTTSIPGMTKTEAPTTTTTKRTTTTTVSAGRYCDHGGRRYPDGAEIYRGVEKGKNTCFIQVCLNGKVVMHNRKCRTTAQPDYPTATTTSTTTTATELPTDLPGCIYNGKFYPINSEIDRGSSKSDNWCYGTTCDSYGQIQHWDNFECFPTTPTPTTFPTTTLPTREPQSEGTTPPPIPKHKKSPLSMFGCYDDGKFYKPGSQISEGYDDVSDWCYGSYCNDVGETVFWDKKNCKKDPTTIVPPTTLPEPPTTKLPTTMPPTTAPLEDSTTPPTDIYTTAPLGCRKDGKFYPPGTHISEVYDESSDWCYGVYCDYKGKRVYWDTWDCKKKDKASPTTTPVTTVPPTTATTEDATTPLGCQEDGKFYQPGSEISEGYDEPSDWCYGVYCDYKGYKVHWDAWECKRKSKTTREPLTTAPESPTTIAVPTRPPTTVPTTEPPTTVSIDDFTTPPRGCYENGRFYQPGEDISEGYDESSDWCYGVYCNYGGEKVSWDNWNCKKKDRQTTEPPTTTPEPPTTIPVTTRPPTTVPTTEPPTTPFIEDFTTPPYGCYENGKFYQPGEDISEGYDESSDWCYGVYCNYGGEKVSWDKWNCKKKDQTTRGPQTTAPQLQTTFPPTTLPPTKDPYIHKTILPIGCFEDGKFYPAGSRISEKYDKYSELCLSVDCDFKGNKIINRRHECEEERPTWPPSTRAPLTTPFGCYSGDKFFAPGAEISEGYDEAADWCYGAICGHDGYIMHWDAWHCKRKSTAEPHFDPTSLPFTFPTSLPSTEEPTTIPTTTAEPPTTPIEPPLTPAEPPTTTFPTTLASSDKASVSPNGCVFDGRLYPAGKEIYDRWDKAKRWCYGLICHQTNKLVYWEKWNCSKPLTTSIPRISLPPSNEKHSAEDNKDLSGESGCIYKGVSYPKNHFIVKKCEPTTKKCSMLFCNRNGRMVPKLLTDVTRHQEISKYNLQAQGTKLKFLNDS